MSKRAAKFVSAIFASFLAGTPLATVSHSAPEAAESCLSKPKGAPPQGGHWYYRIDRATKRPCWYLGDDKEKVSRAGPENSQPAADSVAPPNTANAQRSIANARAELPMPQTRVEPDTSVFAGQRTPATAAAATRLEDNQRANAGDPSAERSVVASRWPELAAMGSPTSSGPATGNSATMAQQPLEPAPPPVAAAVSLAAPASSASPSGSIQQLLIAIVGALALAGLIASAIFRLSGGRRNGRREIRADRRVDWDSARTNRPSLSDDARGAVSMREIGLLPEGSLSRDPRAAVDPNERVSQMLARLARSAAT